MVRLVPDRFLVSDGPRVSGGSGSFSGRNAEALSLVRHDEHGPSSVINNVTDRTAKTISEGAW